MALQLRQRGIDVIAVVSDSDLVGKDDAHLFDFAQATGRALATENVRDFRSIASLYVLSGRSHSGIVFTAPNIFPRRAGRAVGRLVRALEQLSNSELTQENMEVWLDPPEPGPEGVQE